MIICISTGFWTKIGFFDIAEKIVWTDSLVTAMIVIILFVVSVINILLLRRVSTR